MQARGGNGQVWKCSEATLSQDLSGKVYAVTGGNGGVGFEVCLQLAKQGAKVILLSRKAANASTAIAELKAHNMAGPNADISSEILDLGDLASVRACAQAINTNYSRLDGLLNNAGVMATPEGKTKDGFETQFGINHLGHFLLTHLLLQKLKASAPSRIVCTSSVAHNTGVLDLNDPNFTDRKYNKWAAYGASKLANVLHAKHLSTMMQDEKVDVTCVSNHPGWVATFLTGATEVKRGPNQDPYDPDRALPPFLGGQVSLHCLLDPDVKNHPGAYFAQRQFPFQKDERVRHGGLPCLSLNQAADDPELARNLYDLSLELVNAN